MIVGVCRLIANHLHLAFFESIPEVRVLPSTGITRLRRSSYPVRLPPMPPPEATLRPLPSHQTGLPRLPEPPFQGAVPTTPADRAGAYVDCFPASRSLPQMAGGSASALSLSRPAQASLTLRPTGLLSRLKRPLSRGSSPAGYPAEPLVSYQINRQLSGWNLPPLVIRAFGAHCQWETSQAWPDTNDATNRGELTMRGDRCE